MARNTKAGLIKAMGDYYTSQSKTGVDMLFKGISHVQTAWQAYSEDQIKKAEQKFGTLDVMPSGLLAWNDDSKEVFMGDLQSLADQYEVAKKSNNELDAMKIQKEYGDIVKTINKLSTMFTNAKQDTFASDGGVNYSNAMDRTYISQLATGTYTLSKDTDGRYLINTYTEGPNGTLESFSGTLQEFDSAIFLRADKIGDLIDKETEKISKNSNAYNGGVLEKNIKGLVGNREAMSSLFWDSVVDVSFASGMSNALSISDRFKNNMLTGTDAEKEIKMKEYKWHTSEFAALSDEEKQERYTEMVNFVYNTVVEHSQNKWNNKKSGETKETLPTVFGIKKETPTRANVNTGVGNVSTTQFNLMLDKLDEKSNVAVRGWDGRHYKYVTVGGVSGWQVANSDKDARKNKYSNTSEKEMLMNLGLDGFKIEPFELPQIGWIN